jgi:hypothetical protein
VPKLALQLQLLIREAIFSLSNLLSFKNPLI